MNASRLTLALALLAGSCGLAGEENQLTLRGEVRTPEGGAPGGGGDRRGSDRAGRGGGRGEGGRGGAGPRLRGVFGIGAMLHARSEDGTQQTTRIIDAPSVRSAAEKPVALTLAPATGHEVTVVAGGKRWRGLGSWPGGWPRPGASPTRKVRFTCGSPRTTRLAR